jgi:hypothetical protein
MAFSVSSRQPIDQRWHRIVGQMIQKCEIVLRRFLQAGQPATTTPRPPCATDGGSLTK